MKIKKLRLKKVRSMYCVAWQEGKKELSSSPRTEREAKELKDKMLKAN